MDVIANKAWNAVIFPIPAVGHLMFATFEFALVQLLICLHIIDVGCVCQANLSHRI